MLLLLLLLWVVFPLLLEALICQWLLWVSQPPVLSPKPVLRDRLPASHLELTKFSKQNKAPLRAATAHRAHLAGSRDPSVDRHDPIRDVVHRYPLTCVTSPEGKLPAHESQFDVNICLSVLIPAISVPLLTRCMGRIQSGVTIHAREGTCRVQLPGPPPFPDLKALHLWNACRVISYSVQLFMTKQTRAIGLGSLSNHRELIPRGALDVIGHGDDYERQDPGRSKLLFSVEPFPNQIWT